MKDVKEESLRRCLREACCMELPRAYSEREGGFWMKGIALVRKRNMTQSYCMVSHRSDGMVVYEKDFGAISPIAGLVSVYPYVFLDMSRYAPNVSGNALRALIVREYGMSFEDVDALTDVDLEEWKIKMAIRNQESADRVFIASGHIDDADELPADEDGFTDVFVDPKVKKDMSSVITAEDGSSESFTDIITASDVRESAKKRVREQSKASTARVKAKRTKKDK